MPHEIASDSIAVITWEDDFGSGLPSRVGRQFVPFPEFSELLDHPPIQFRLRDEDDEIHYRGLVRDDPQCECQEVLSEFGARDTGGFIIEVLRDGVWTMDIG